jgi:predicted DNA-binding transcriptional regulator AlpA
MSDPSRLNLMIRKREAPRYVGLRQTQIDEAIKAQEFPEPIVLREGGRAVGFLEDELVSYQEYRRAKRDKRFAGSWKAWCAARATEGTP